LIASLGDVANLDREPKMSEQEFDLYLKLLAKCLHLTSGQREQIADELRDHLESRLDELDRAGVPREQAVVQALDEFGDAAVLADDFATIARLKRRRFLMRLSLGSVCALTAALLITFAFWPDNRAVRGPEPVVAQEKPKVEKSKAEKPRAQKSRSESGAVAKKGRDAKARDSSSRASAVAGLGEVDHPLSSDVGLDAKIAAALNAPVDFMIEPQALKDAMEFIAAHYQIPILFDQKALDDANVDVTTEVKCNVLGIRMRDMLNLMLDTLATPIAYEIRNGVLMISTHEKISDHLEMVVYDCRDLVQVGTLDHFPAEITGQSASGSGGGMMGGAMFQVAGAGGAAPAAAKAAPAEKANNHPARRLPLIQTIISATGPDSWDEGASISEFGGLLVVRQNPFVHERIKRLLASIRWMRKDGAFATLTDQYDVEAKTRAAYEDRVTATRISALEHAIEFLRRQQAAPVKAAPSAPPK
jgi:dihydropteroate synthase